ncbi:MAG: extracellular solute-binding protein [Rhizobiales bacterium]|nr:extracellular solute-binding protein [Hyphomicrobiales bacterium]
MIKLNRRLALSALLAACVGGSTTALADMKALEEAARKEGQVTWYVASIDARNAEAAGRAFTAKYGPKVNVVRAPSQVMFQRLTQDLSQNARNADVFSSVDVGNFVTLKEQGALMAYKPENATRLLPAFQGLDKDGMFHSTVASVIIIAYNKEKMKADEAPQNWTNLLDAKWIGKIALGHPAFSGFAGNWAAQMNKLYGKSFLQRLEKQKPQVGRSLFDAVNLVSSGERLVTAAPIAPILENADKGKPLAVVYPTDGSILVATPSAVLKNAPHPNGAKLFMEFLLGPEFGGILVKARYEAMRADVKPLPGAKSVTEIKTVRPTIEETTKGIPQVAESWRDVFGQ